MRPWEVARPGVREVPGDTGGTCPRTKEAGRALTQT